MRAKGGFGPETPAERYMPAPLSGALARRRQSSTRMTSTPAAAVCVEHGMDVVTTDEYLECLRQCVPVVRWQVFAIRLPDGKKADSAFFVVGGGIAL